MIYTKCIFEVYAMYIANSRTFRPVISLELLNSAFSRFDLYIIFSDCISVYTAGILVYFRLPETSKPDFQPLFVVIDLYACFSIGNKADSREKQVDLGLYGPSKIWRKKIGVQRDSDSSTCNKTK